MRHRRAGGPAMPPSPPRAEQDLADIVNDVRSLRRTLETDLTVAAAAVEQDAPDLAADIVDADRGELRAFLAHVSDRIEAIRSAEELGEPAPLLDAVVPAPRSTVLVRVARSRLLPLAPLAAAIAAAAVIAAGVVRAPGAAPVSVGQVQPVAASWTAFTRAATHAENARQLLAAAARLHQSLAELLVEAGHNPTLARRALRLLELEELLLVRTHPSGMVLALEESQKLVAQLVAAAGLPAAPLLTTSDVPIPTTALQVQHLLLPPSTPKPAPSPSAKTTPAPSPSATPTHSPSPSPSPSQTQPGLQIPSPKQNTLGN